MTRGPPLTSFSPASSWHDGQRGARGPAVPVSARFLLFDASGAGWGKVLFPQVAFAGRSNAGKSSLLNALTGQAGLARVSRTPGRTRGIAFFEIEGRWAFADLPGYGYARVSRAERDAWRGLMERYFDGCRLLRKVYVLVDLRRGPEEEEETLARFLGTRGIRYGWVGTKADKIGRAGAAAAAARFSGADWLEGGGTPFLVSARTGVGIGALWRDIRLAFSA